MHNYPKNYNRLTIANKDIHHNDNNDSNPIGHFQGLFADITMLYKRSEFPELTESDIKDIYETQHQGLVGIPAKQPDPFYTANPLAIELLDDEDEAKLFISDQPSGPEGPRLSRPFRRADR